MSALIDAHDLELIDRFVSHELGRGISSKTAYIRRCSAEQFGRAIHPVSLTMATSSLVEEWIFEQSLATTRRSYRSRLMAFYAWALRHKVVDVNPVVDTDSIREPKVLPRPIAPSWIRELMDTAPPVERLMIGLGAYVGLRVGEMAALSTQDIDLDSPAPTLTVRGGKGGTDRIVPVHPDLIPLLRSLPPGPAFKLSRGTLGNRLALHLRSLGVHATTHQLRHSFGTELARSSAGNIVLVAQLMGHESIDTSMRYIGWSGGEAASAVAGMFPAGPGRSVERSPQG